MGIASFFGFGHGQVRLGALSVRQWTWVLVVASALIQYYVAVLSALEFRQQAGDLGIFMQAFSNTGHGRLFWNTQAYLHYGTASLLNIHFAWPIFAIYPIYAAYPSMTTLFVIQAIVLSVAAIPLASLTAVVTGSQKKGLIAAGLYLVWAPMYVGLPNSFHLEAFLPVEFFLLVLLWWRKQYSWALAMTVIAGFTLDVAPVLTALLGLMFLTYPLVGLLRRVNPPANELIFHSPSGDPVRPVIGFFSRLWAYLRWKPVVAAIGIVVLSGLCLITVRYLEAHFPAWLGVSGSTVGELRLVGFALSNFQVALLTKVEFWLILLASVGFLPFLYPRILVILVPWAGYTFGQATEEWYQLPAHYMAIAAVPLFLGVAFGLEKLSFRRPKRLQVSAAAPSRGSGGTDSPRAGRWAAPTSGASTASRSTFAVSCALLIAIIGVNVGLSPLNPLTAPLIRDDGGVIFTGNGGQYGLTFTPAPGFSQAQTLVGLVPRDATVLVSDDLYPLISADPNAWCFNADFNPAFVPFNNTTIPTYVLAQPSYLKDFNQYVGAYLYDDVNYSMSALVWNPNVYGVRGWTPSTTLGPIFLFEEGYTGATELVGSVSAPSITFYLNATLFNGSAAYPVSNYSYSPQFPVSLYSPPNQEGEMWEAADLHHPLPAGTYNVTMTFQAGITSAAGCPRPAPNNTSTILRLEGNPVTYPTSSLFSTLTCSQYLGLPHVGQSAWRNWTVEVSFSNPEYQYLFFGKRPSGVNPQPFSIVTAAVQLTPVIA